VRVFVDVADTADNREFFVGFKEQLKSRFRQIDIWMTTYLIEVISTMFLFSFVCAKPCASSVRN
jgi:hypothetical protein